MQIVNISSHAIASLKSKATNLPKLWQDKTNQDPEAEIHEPVHSETVQPVTEAITTLQPSDIPRPVHAKRTQASSPPVNVPIPVLQPIDIPRPVHVKPAQAATQHATTAQISIPVPTLHPFDIPRPVHAKKASGKSPTKKDKPASTPVPNAPRPQPATNEPTQLQNPTATTATNTLYSPPSTSPLFPSPPALGPPTLKSRLLTLLYQLISILLTTPLILIHTLFRLFTFRSFSRPSTRPFATEEARRTELRKIDALAWKKHEIQKKSKFPDIAASASIDLENGGGEVLGQDGFVPTEGGKDKLIPDVGYYARRVGLDCEEVKVQTEDGWILDLWHVYDPREYTPLSRAQRMIRGPECIDDIKPPSRALGALPTGGGVTGTGIEKGKGRVGNAGKQRYPVLMMPGLMQTSGVYCTNDDHSLAFWLCKQGYDVWLGNNRCGIKPEHIEFKKSDPRIWNWNITHLATLDLPALMARVLSETSSPTLGLIAHSQGTAQTLIALSKHQRPTISPKISVFCALAPAAYTGPLFNQYPLKLLRILLNPAFRLLIGPTSFLPILSLFNHIPGKIPYHLTSTLTYKLTSFLFSINDTNWDISLRSRAFLFSTPTCTSSSLLMQWWFSRSGFPHHGSILSTHSQVQRELEEDLLQDYFRNAPVPIPGPGSRTRTKRIDEDLATQLLEKHVREPRPPESWFADGVSDEPGGRVPPMAFWIPGGGRQDACGMFDGRQLMNRFERGREPGVRVLDVQGQDQEGERREGEGGGGGGANVIEGYGSLDLLWACDVIEKVGCGVRDAVWRTVGVEGRERFRVPRGCEALEGWVDDRVFGGEEVKDGDSGSTDLEDSESEREKEKGKEKMKVLDDGEKKVGNQERVD